MKTQKAFASDAPSLETLRTSNHAALLGAQKELRALLLGRTIAAPEPQGVEETIREVSAVLHDDALVSTYLGVSPGVSLRKLIGEYFHRASPPQDPSLLDACKDHLDASYFGELKALLNNSLFGSPSSGRAAILETSEALLSRRKRLSDNHAMSEIRAYLKDDSNSFEAKVAYLGGFRERGDHSLLEFGSGYFEEQRKIGALSDAQITLIQTALGGFARR